MAGAWIICSGGTGSGITAGAFIAGSATGASGGGGGELTAGFGLGTVMQPANPQQSSNAATEILVSIANLLDHTRQHPYINATAIAPL
jgi:hypothetical protein